MAVRNVDTNVIVDANVADVTAQIENTETDKTMILTYIGNGKMMVTEVDDDV